MWAGYRNPSMSGTQPGGFPHQWRPACGPFFQQTFLSGKVIAVGPAPLWPIGSRQGRRGHRNKESVEQAHARAFVVLAAARRAVLSGDGCQPTVNRKAGGGGRPDVWGGLSSCPQWHWKAPPTSPPSSTACRRGHGRMTETERSLTTAACTTVTRLVLDRALAGSHRSLL